MRLRWIKGLPMTDKTAPEPVTATVSDAAPAQASAKRKRAFPAPSTNPVTNVLIADVVLRSVDRLARGAVEKTILKQEGGTQAEGGVLEQRSMLSTAALYGAARIASRSVPGALLVSGGLLAKALYDRGRARNAARAKGNLKAPESDE